MQRKKNCIALSNLDWYADSVSLTLNGNKSHQTRLGGCLTVLLFLTTLGYWVWGTVKVNRYADPVVFTDNLNPSSLTDGGSPLPNNLIIGGSITVNGNYSADIYSQYLSIVFVGPETPGGMFRDGYGVYNSTLNAS